MLGIFKIARAKNGDDDPKRSSSGNAKFGTAGVLIKGAAPGRLYLLHVTNHAATAYVLMIFDKATAPVNTDVPIARRLLPASGEVVVDLTEFGGACALGIGIAISTAASPNNLTLAAADDAHYFALYK